MNFFYLLLIFIYLANMKNTPKVGLCDTCLHKGITTWVNTDQNDTVEDIYYYFCKKVQRDPGQFMELAQANREDYFGYYGYGNALSFKTAIVNCTEYQKIAYVEITYCNYDPVTSNLYISWELKNSYGLETLEIYEDSTLLPVYTLAAAPDGLGSVTIPTALVNGEYPTYIIQMSGGAKSLRASILIQARIEALDISQSSPNTIITYNIFGTDGAGTYGGRLYDSTGTELTSFTGQPALNGDYTDVIPIFIPFPSGQYYWILELEGLGIFSSPFYYNP